jgi:hypothetical protein
MNRQFNSQTKPEKTSETKDRRKRYEPRGRNQIKKIQAPLINYKKLRGTNVPQENLQKLILAQHNTTKH